MDYEKQRIIIRIEMIALKPDGSNDYYAPQECLFQYDLPRAVYERRKWVPRWRAAKLQCMYPKRTLQTTNGYYHPMNEEERTLKETFDKLRSAKGMVTKITNALDQARKHYQPTLFVPTVEETEAFQKAEAKLQRYQAQVNFYTEQGRQLLANAA